MTVILDADKMKMRTETFEYLKEALELPEYFGANLDALYDCLTEMTEADIVIVNTANAGDFFQKIMRVFRDAARENDGLQLRFE